MIIVVLSSLFILYMLITSQTRKFRKAKEKAENEFWERERMANSTRKKPLDGLPYISIPMDSLPTRVMQDDEFVAQRISTIQSLCGEKIVNFTGYTNTDLKLEYGTANINILTEFDQRYTLLVRSLQEWAEALYTEGYTSEAQTILEYAISIGTDASHSYYLLADIYDAKGYPEEKARLIDAAQSINSSMKDIIVRTLQGSGPYSGWLHSA